MNNKVVLDIEEMQELETLGVDTSSASFLWSSINDENYNPVSWLPIYRSEPEMTIDKMRESFPYTYKEGNLYYAFCTDDMLRLIEELSGGNVRIEIYNKYSLWNVFVIWNGIRVYETSGYLNVIDAVFDAFKFCKVQKYIDKKNE